MHLDIYSVFTVSRRPWAFSVYTSILVLQRGSGIIFVIPTCQLLCSHMFMYLFFYTLKYTANSISVHPFQATCEPSIHLSSSGSVLQSLSHLPLALCFQSVFRNMPGWMIGLSPSSWWGMACLLLFRVLSTTLSQPRPFCRPEFGFREDSGLLCHLSSDQVTVTEGHQGCNSRSPSSKVLMPTMS